MQGILVVIVVLLAFMFVSGKASQSYESYGHFGFIMKPLIGDKDKIMLKTQSNRYVTACGNCENVGNINNKCSYVLCLREEPYNSSVFTLHKHRDGRWSLETVMGKFWKRCQKCIHSCDSAICADGINSNLRTHKFHLIKNPDGTIRLKSDNGRFLESCPCPQSCGKIICAKGLGGDINFTVEKILSVPKPKPVLRFKPQWQNTSVPDGVLLSNVQ